MILGLHHVTALAGGAQQNLDFYTKFLGLRLVKRTVNYDDPGTYHFYFGDEQGHPGTLLTFFPWGRIRQPRKGSGQAIAVAFCVAPGALAEWSARCAEARVTTDPIQDRFGQQVLTLYDPDRIAVELVAVPGAPRQLRQIHSVTLCEREIHVPGILGLELAGVEGNRYRYGVGGAFIDVLHEPDTEIGKMAAGIIHHVALRVEDEAAQLDWRARIMGAGLRVSPVKDRNYFHSIYFRRPGSTLFEIATTGPGFLIDETEAMLGSALCLPRWLEPHRESIAQRLPPISL